MHNNQQPDHQREQQSSGFHLPPPPPYIHPPTQITTCRGIVMGRLRSPQRNLEVSLMKFCLQKLGGLPPGVGVVLCNHARKPK